MMAVAYLTYARATALLSCVLGPGAPGIASYTLAPCLGVQ